MGRRCAAGPSLLSSRLPGAESAALDTALLRLARGEHLHRFHIASSKSAWRAREQRRSNSGGCARLRLLATLAAVYWPQPIGGVLRYPDGSFESRFPLHVDDCGQAPLEARPVIQDCLLRLRSHLLEDTDCNRVICDAIHTSTPIEVYANQTDWAPFKNLCGNMQELFLGIFDLGVDLLGRSATEEDGEILVKFWEAFFGAVRSWIDSPDAEGAPAYANTTRSVLQRHAIAASSLAGNIPLKAMNLLDMAVALARRLQLLIENVSVTLLLNFYVAQLEQQGRLERGRNLVHEMYGDVRSVRTVFHEIPGKRWDALSHLLQSLGVAERRVAIAEVGVEAANTSQRLLERNPQLSYIGVDPYVNNDGLYVDVVQRLEPFKSAGRCILHRETSAAASAAVADGSLDLVFLDARHDFEAVKNDILAWSPKLHPGGILSGHDFSWMFPTVAMAVYQAAFSAPERTIHLTPDGVWWLQL